MAKKKILVDIDFNQNQLLNPVLQNLSEDPSTGVEGQKYFNTTNHIERTYRNGAWQNATDEYELPAASTNTRGGIKVGNRLYIENEDVLNVHRASKVIEGIGRFATDAEVEAGTQPNVAIDPVQLKSVIDGLPTPMQFKGTLGSGGTITVLPTASSSNIGFLYLVISDGTYDGQSAKAGDEFVSNGTNWILVPSGDEPAQIQADWNQTDNTALDYIKNKPTIPAAQVQANWTQTTETAVDFIKNKNNLFLWSNGVFVQSGVSYANLEGNYAVGSSSPCFVWMKDKPSGVTDSDNIWFRYVYANISKKFRIKKNNIFLTWGDWKQNTVYLCTCMTDIDNAIFNIQKEFTVQSDWNQADDTQPDFIKNKPIPIATAADEGKMLQVNALGQYELVTIVNSELQPY